DRPGPVRGHRPRRLGARIAGLARIARHRSPRRRRRRRYLPQIRGSGRPDSRRPGGQCCRCLTGRRSGLGPLSANPRWVERKRRHRRARMRGLCGVYEMSIVTPSQDTGIAITLAPRRRSNFVQTQNVETITRRALAYLNAGFSVHFRGPAGTGKTPLALEVAALLNRPTVMIAGDEDMATATLVGSQRGYHYRKVVDRFIHNVTKTE